MKPKESVGSDVRTVKHQFVLCLEQSSHKYMSLTQLTGGLRPLALELQETPEQGTLNTITRLNFSLTHLTQARGHKTQNHNCQTLLKDISIIGL